LPRWKVSSFAPGGTIEFDPDTVAYPMPFSQAKPGTYQFMALLDTDHTYSYHGQDGGDLTSEVVKVDNVNQGNTTPIQLTISRRTPGRPKPADNESVKLVEFQSKMLSDFWGRPITMRAGVVLPPSYLKDTSKHYAAVYNIHGFGGNHTAAWRQSGC
jgi:hypothetical protein